MFIFVIRLSCHFDCKWNCFFKLGCILSAWDVNGKSQCVVNVTVDAAIRINGDIEDEFLCFSKR